MKNGRKVKRWLAAGCLVLLGMFFAVGVRAEDGNGEVVEDGVVVAACSSTRHLGEWGFCLGAGFAGVTGILLVLGCCLTKKREGAGNNKLYCFEVVLLVGVLLSIACGTYHLLSRIVDLEAKETGGRAVASPDYNGAVLEAYGQLSNELGRGCALLGILGAFFGLVLPTGGYLLQLKAVKREEEITGKKIQDELNAFRSRMEKVIDEKIGTVDAEVKSKLEEIWEDVAKMQYCEYAKCYLSLSEHQAKEGESASTYEICLWAKWIVSILCFIQVLSHVSDTGFVRQKLDLLNRNLKEILQNSTLKTIQTAFRQIRNGRPYSSEEWLVKLTQRFPNEVGMLTELLEQAGVGFK